MTWREMVPWRSAGKVPMRYEGGPISALQQELNKVFGSFFSGFPFEPVSQLWGKGFETFSPKVNIQETETELVVKAELPGLDEKDIHLAIGEDYLTIQGERKHEGERKEGGSSYYESSYGSFQRTIPLDVEIATDKVDAALKKGVLTVRLPKSDRARRETKKITVRAE